jgi:DNA-binding PadR family transcriptional regulator
MPLPELTSLQFLVLASLPADGELAGRDLRAALEKDVSMRLAAFYRLMSRLEEAGFVRGRYATIDVDGQTARERRYKITGDGLRACTEFEEFAASRAVNTANLLGGIASA